MINRAWGSVRVCVWCVLLVLSCSLRAEANSVTLGWDASSSPGVAGYFLMWGTSPGQHTRQVDVNGNTSYTIPYLPNGVYYFVVRAYALDGSLSAISNQVIVALGVPMPVTCSTPDPFAAVGGGTCYNDSWLPPGMPIPGSTAPTLAPAPAPAPAPTSVQGCAAPDPFASMGGGTCYNGGWLPPGMSIPGNTTPAPTPAPAPSPAPAPTSVQGCAAPDPFATMGGGTCYNGGWLPPGMAVPGATTTSPTPVPTPPPPSPQKSVCYTADPFLALGGGTCYLGSWLPPGMEIVMTGTMKLLSSGWRIIGDDDKTYVSPTSVAPKYLLDAAKVTFRGRTLPSSQAPAGMTAVEILSIAFR